MASRKHERTRDRAFAVQVLYTSELQGESPSKLLDEGLCLVATEADPEPAPSEAADEAPSEFGRICEGALSEYALGLIRGVQEYQAAIDERLEGASENWALSRMPIVDRSILRLAVYEMFQREDVPVSVSINEAVELAKAFGGEDDSPRFVNGVLGRIARSMADAEEDEPEASDDGAAEGEVAEGTPVASVIEAAATAEAVDAVVGASGAAACVQGEV
ncbi:transcription antitermination factor NusB [Adlercreutzia caecimuris]|uniref:transcription antitermination factor NusB n=1 Tax=Adlercreutzia caecimuris TaxID=671266 RepID=UPI00272CD771|nr:transcription antitermination factor NusB [Adlercreutzia caecimuris]